MINRTKNERDYIKTTSQDAIEYLDTLWDDMTVPLSATRIPSAGLDGPDFVKFRDNGAGSIGVYADAFDSVTQESALFQVQTLHKWKEGSTLKLHVHWAKSNANAGGVTWGVEFTNANIAGVFPNTTIAKSSTIIAGSGGDHEHNITSILDIDMSGKLISNMFVARVFRDPDDAGDTYGSDAFLLEVDFHMEIDRPGSRQELIK